MCEKMKAEFFVYFLQLILAHSVDEHALSDDAENEDFTNKLHELHSELVREFELSICMLEQLSHENLEVFSAC